MMGRAALAEDVLCFHPDFAVFSRQDEQNNSLVHEMCFYTKAEHDNGQSTQKQWVCVATTERVQKWVAKSHEGLSMQAIASELGLCVELLLAEVHALQKRFLGAVRLPENDPLWAEKMAFLAAFKAQQSAKTQPSQKAYHQEEITDAETQFDEVETTVSHLYAEPHSALKGRTYGQAFVDAWNPANEGPLRILEVGCGTGRFAKAVLERLQQRRNGLSGVEYTLMDLSPALQDAQKKRLAAFGETCRFVLGDAQDQSAEKPFPKGPFDGVLCNEVIADFDVVPYLEASDEVKSWLHLAEDENAETYIVHSGTFSFLKNAAQVLSDEGKLLLTEYRRTQKQSAPVVLGNHVEYPICEKQILQFMAHESWQTELSPLIDWMGFNDVKVISSATWSALANYLQNKGQAAVTPYAFEPEQWKNLCLKLGVQVTPEKWTRVGQQSFVDPRNFFCLQMQLQK